MGKRLEIKTMVLVLGIVIVVMTTAMLVSYPVLTEFGSSFATMFGTYGVILAVLLIAGAIRLHIRFRPMVRFMEMRERGEKPDHELFEATRILAIKYPLIGSKSVAMFITIGSFFLAGAMWLKWHRPWGEVLYALIVCLGAIIFVVTFNFFAVKIALRPVIEELFKEKPSVWELPPPIRISIRAKVFLASLCLLAVMALLVLSMNTYFISMLEQHLGNTSFIADFRGTVLKTTLVGLLIAGVIGLIVGTLLSGDLGWPLKQITDAAEQISRNERQDVIPWMSEDESDTLAASLNRMTQGLLANLKGEVLKAENLLVSLRETVITLARSADSISEVTTRQTGRAGEQTTDAQEVSSASIEISAAARRISTHAQAVEDMSKRARDASENGGDDLGAAVAGITTVANRFKKVNDAIQKLGERSQEIRLIVELIEEISSQIDLLALNATLEAAGAGQVGLRFGVVATEVGRLAEKTSDAIARIHIIIEDALSAIELTSELARESEEAARASADVAKGLEESFKRIFDLVSSTNQLAKEIGQATMQQTTSSDLMVETIQNFANTAGQVEADSRMLDVSVRELADQAERLRKLSTSS